MKTLKVIFTLLALLPTLAFSQAIFTENKDEFTGKDNSDVHIVSAGERYLLAWKCFSNELNILFPHDYLGGDSDGDVIVQTKFDENDPSGRKYYSLSKNNQLTHFDRSDVSGFTEDAIEATEVMVRITDPLDGQTLTAAFITRGLKDALKKLSCYP